jgi:myosin-crossreactive antigen
VNTGICHCAAAQALIRDKDKTGKLLHIFNALPDVH